MRKVMKFVLLALTFTSLMALLSVQWIAGCTYPDVLCP